MFWIKRDLFKHLKTVKGMLFFNTTCLPISPMRKTQKGELNPDHGFQLVLHLPKEQNHPSFAKMELKKMKLTEELYHENRISPVMIKSPNRVAQSKGKFEIIFHSQELANSLLDQYPKPSDKYKARSAVYFELPFWQQVALGQKKAPAHWK